MEVGISNKHLDRTRAKNNTMNNLRDYRGSRSSFQSVEFTAIPQISNPDSILSSSLRASPSLAESTGIRHFAFCSLPRALVSRTSSHKFSVNNSSIRISLFLRPLRKTTLLSRRIRRHVDGYMWQCVCVCVFVCMCSNLQMCVYITSIPINVRGFPRCGNVRNFSSLI